jgi:hypothetical protein
MSAAYAGTADGIGEALGQVFGAEGLARLASMHNEYSIDIRPCLISVETVY